MSSVVRSVLGAAILVTGASAATAQYATQPAANQPVQASTAPATVASNNASVAAVAPVAEQVQKPRSKITDQADPYGGHDPNSLAGNRAFWQGQNPY